MTPHPLDRPVWHALRTRQAWAAQGDARAVRFAAGIGLFGAAADDSRESADALARLIAPGEMLGTVEATDEAPPPGTRVIRSARLVQMVAERIAPPPVIACLELGDADAPEMLALATRTSPGPFFPDTHRLGGFVGLRVGGALVAMAGERMQLPGHAEVSAVCTDPDHRGRGHARALMHLVAARIAARGEIPFLHSYPDNAGALALYESLGFRVRAEVRFTLLERADQASSDSARSVSAIQPPPNTRSPA